MERGGRSQVTGIFLHAQTGRRGFLRAAFWGLPPLVSRFLLSLPAPKTPNLTHLHQIPGAVGPSPVTKITAARARTRVIFI